MHPVDCPEWEYQNVPEHGTLLASAARELLLVLRRGELDALEHASDTRTIHARLFRELTPKDHPYFAGKYRGASFRCLQYYSVGVPGDPRVGTAPERVQGEMDALARVVRYTIKGLDHGHALPNSQLSRVDKRIYTVAAACRVFEQFLRIHPYANGNGHAARFCLTAILGRYGYWLRSFPIEPRPPDPPYTDLVVAYRNGKREPLEKFIHQLIAAP